MTASIVSLTAEHELQDACAEQHCCYHNVDEPTAEGEKFYVICPECWHLYRTRRELRQRYRAVTWQIVRDGFRRYGKRHGVTEFAVWLLHAIALRADRITFCQYCIHDF